MKKIDVLFRQQALESENSANITPKQTEKVEVSAEIAESSASTKNCPSTSAGVPSQCDDTHSNHDSSDDKSYISQAKHMLWVLKRTILIRGFFWAPTTNGKSDCKSDFRIYLWVSEE